MEIIALDRHDPAAEQAGKVGPYRLEHRLGSGGMGTVWRAQDERLKRAVALKRILPAATEDHRLRERFRREAEAVARLNHPAIVHIYDIVEAQESDWIVMELVEGRTLHELLRNKGPLDPQWALRLGRDIAEGLAEAHIQGFIHRDLKAPNIMVTPLGRGKILDFGIAKEIQPEAQETTLSMPGTIVGTSYAMSPEQAMGLRLDPRSDLFSLGSLLYEMVTGVTPFRAETVQATLVRVCSLRHLPVSSIRPNVPRDLSDLIDRLLQKDPDHRPGSAAEVATALEQIAVAQEIVPAREQVPLVGSAASDQETVLELPVRQVQAFSLFESTVGQSSLSALRLAMEPVRSSGSALSVLNTIGGIRLVPGIVFLLIMVASAVYLLRPSVVQSPSQSLYREGLTYLDGIDRKGNLDQAIGRFKKVIAQDKTHAAAHAALARAYWLKFQSGDVRKRDPMWLDRALPMAERAVTLDPDLAAARVSLGLVLESIGRPDEALHHIERALVLEPANGDAYYAAGRIHDSQRNDVEAEAAFKKATELRPDAITFNALGSFYFGMRRTDDAIAAFRRSIELAPDNIYAYAVLGQMYSGRGDLAEATSLYQKALQIRPDWIVYSNLSAIYFEQGLYQQAAEAAEKALKMPGVSNEFPCWTNLGMAYRWIPNQKDRSHQAFLRAIQLIQEKLRLEPGDVTLRSELAMHLALVGDLTGALAELRKLRDFSGKSPDNWYRIAGAYELSAQRIEALAALENALRGGFPTKAIEKDPDLIELRADARYRRLRAKLSKERAQRYNRLNMGLSSQS